MRNSRTLVDSDPGLVGNLLVERLVGAHIHQVTKEEYVRHGSTHLGNLVVKELQDKGKKPLLIPVGGSNATGTWGYLEFMQELQQQTCAQPFTDIVMVSLCLKAEQRPDFSSRMVGTDDLYIVLLGPNSHQLYVEEFAKHLGLPAYLASQA